jgi:tyrosyl-tRNA synthetase
MHVANLTNSQAPAPTLKPHIADAEKIRQVLTRGVAEILPSVESLVQLMQKRRIRLYLGIDPTGAFLTLGHSVVLRKLQQFAKLGHEVILLVGSGTVKIGDPTGRDSTRPVLTDEQILANFADWQTQASKILTFDHIQLRYNGDWLDALTFPDMVRLLARTTAQQLLERDMFQERFKQGLPVFTHELLYPILQGYDSVVLDVDLEIGGSDQTFNMLMGRTLQKNMQNKDKWVLSTPIINGTDGRKMSKSYNNFVALTESAEDMYGKIMSIADEQIVEYFTLLTDESLEKISDYELEIKSGENPMKYKKLLAETITTMYHDAPVAQAAAKHFENTVQKQAVPDNLPEIHVSVSELGGLTVLELLAQCQPETTRSQLRRLIDQGGVQLLYDDQEFLVTNPTSAVELKRDFVVKIGKRGFYQISLS